MKGPEELATCPIAVLLVEDSSDDTLFIQRAWGRLEGSSGMFRVRDGEEAKEFLSCTGRFEERISEELPKVILSDLKMPLCDGLELLKWVREQPNFKSLPFVILSSSQAESDIKTARAAGVTDYLIKPSRLDQFKSILERVRPLLKASVEEASTARLSGQ